MPQRFPNSAVNYLVDDLQHPTTITKQQFDFILESYTLQVSDTVRPKAIKNITQLLASGGTLLVICHGRDVTEFADNLPFSLTQEGLSYFEVGLIQMNFKDYYDFVRRFRIKYKRVDY